MPTRLENAINSGRIHRLSGKGAVEINDMQILEALLLESPRLRRRIAVEYCRARHVALLKPHGEAFFEIDSRKRITATTSENLRSKQAPGVGSSPGGTGCRPCCREPTMAVSGPP
mgnify:CR=1 FL=1